jgi:hypothetical protein
MTTPTYQMIRCIIVALMDGTVMTTIRDTKIEGEGVRDRVRPGMLQSVDSKPDYADTIVKP